MTASLKKHPYQRDPGIPHILKFSLNPLPRPGEKIGGGAREAFTPVTLICDV
ncbi:hypothetical protein FJTKL_06548, partial [Diaporthe vaccinii]